MMTLNCFLAQKRVRNVGQYGEERGQTIKKSKEIVRVSAHMWSGAYMAVRV